MSTSKRRNARSNPEMMPPVAIDQATLYAALGVLRHASVPKSSVPALSHVLIEGAGDEVLVSASDMRCTLSALLPGEGDGAYLLPIKQLAALVEPEDKPKRGKKASSRPATAVKLHVDPDDVKVRREDYLAELAKYKERFAKWKAAKAEADAKDVTWIEGYGLVVSPPEKPTPIALKTQISTPDLDGSLLGLTASDFPRRPRVVWEQTTEIDIAEVLSAMAWTAIAVSGDEGRPHLNALLVTPEEGGQLVSTDGHRLHLAPFSYTGALMQLPLAAVGQLLRLAKMEKSGKVLVSTGKLHRTEEPFARFDVGVWSLVVALVDPATHLFPPYARVIPERADRPVVLRVPTAKLAATTKRLQKIAEGNLLVTMAPASDVTVWECDDPDAGGARINVPVVFEKQNISEPLVAQFVSRYMLEAVEGLGEEATISFAGPEDACRLDGDNGRLAITMPMRR